MCDAAAHVCERLWEALLRNQSTQSEWPGSSLVRLAARALVFYDGEPLGNGQFSQYPCAGGAPYHFSALAFPPSLDRCMRHRHAHTANIAAIFCHLAAISLVLIMFDIERMPRRSHLPFHLPSVVHIS